MPSVMADVALSLGSDVQYDTDKKTKIVEKALEDVGMKEYSQVSRMLLPNHQFNFSTPLLKIYIMSTLSHKTASY